MSNALPINLDDLLHQRGVEGDRIEYKAGWNPDAVLHTLCAFANDFHNLGGGYVVMGQDCDEAGLPIFPPKGIPKDQLDKIQKQLLGFCNLIQPIFFPSLFLEVYEGRHLMILWAPGGQNRPYRAPRSVTSKKKEYRYYIRRFSSTVEASGDEERELISLTASVPFDDRYCQQATVQDLSPRLIKEFLTQVGSDLAAQVDELPLEDIGRQLNIVGGPSEHPLPKNVGLMFFHGEPHRFFPATQIDVVWFPDGPGGDQFEEKIFKGPLGSITRDSIAYIQRNYLKETVVKHADRPEAERFWNFPLVAIEEAVVNAVYHRSYEEREPVEIRISPEEMFILSYPGPDRSIQMGDLSRGKVVSRRYRNRRVGEFLKELELTEGRSTGIPKIFRAMAENGSAKPEFETDETRSFFRCRLPAHPGVQDGVQDGVHDGVHDQAHDALSELEIKLLTACKTTPVKAARLLEASGYQIRTGNYKQAVAKLLEKKWIEMTLPESPRSKNQMYQLTELGKQQLEASPS